MNQSTAAAKFYLKQQGLSATDKQVARLLKQFPGATIVMMARQRGFVEYTTEPS